MPSLFFTTELTSLLSALQSRLERRKLAGYDLSFHSWPGNSYGREGSKNKKIGHPQKDKQDRQDTEKTGIYPVMQSLILHSDISFQ